MLCFLFLLNLWWLKVNLQSILHETSSIQNKLLSYIININVRLIVKIVSICMGSQACTSNYIIFSENKKKQCLGPPTLYPVSPRPWPCPSAPTPTQSPCTLQENFLFSNCLLLQKFQKTWEIKTTFLFINLYLNGPAIKRRTFFQIDEQFSKKTIHFDVNCLN